jgi:hypothetical protein
MTIQDHSRRQIRGLQILLLEGAKAESHPLGRGVPPVVEVRDDLDRPVEGAEVTFDLPVTGAGGFFGGNERTATVLTNWQGQATSPLFTVGPQTGPFTIRVSARFRDVNSQISVIQSVSVRPRTTEAILRPRSSHKKWIVVGVIAGAGAAGLAYALTRGSTAPVKINLGGAAFTQP